MNAKELADQLNGIEYSATIHFHGSDLCKQAKAAGLVVAYGFSDDLLEFDGAIYDEAGAPGAVLIDDKGLLPDWDSVGEDEDACAHFLHRKPNAKEIEAVWSEEGSGYAWTLKTDIPHEVFSIMEDGEGLSRGIVFALADLVPVPAEQVGAEPGTVPGGCYADSFADGFAADSGHQCCGKCEKPVEQSGLTPDDYKAAIRDLANRLQTADLVIAVLLSKAGGSVTVTDPDGEAVIGKTVASIADAASKSITFWLDDVPAVQVR